MRLHFSCYSRLIRIVLNMQDLVAMCSFVSVNYVSPQVASRSNMTSCCLLLWLVYTNTICSNPPPSMWDFGFSIIIDRLLFKPRDINQCFKCLFDCLNLHGLKYPARYFITAAVQSMDQSRKREYVYFPFDFLFSFESNFREATL